MLRDLSYEVLRLRGVGSKGLGVRSKALKWRTGRIVLVRLLTVPDGGVARRVPLVLFDPPAVLTVTQLMGCNELGLAHVP